MHNPQTIHGVIKTVHSGELLHSIDMCGFDWDEQKILNLLDSLFIGESMELVSIGLVTIIAMKNHYTGAKRFIRNYGKKVQKHRMPLLPSTGEPEVIKVVVNDEAAHKLQALYISIHGSYKNKKVYFKLDAEKNERKFYFIDPAEIKDDRFYLLSRLMKRNPQILHGIAGTLTSNKRMLIFDNVQRLRFQFMHKPIINIFNIELDWHKNDRHHKPKIKKIVSYKTELESLKTFKKDFFKHIKGMGLPSNFLAMAAENDMKMLIDKFYGEKKHFMDLSSYKKSMKDFDYFEKLLEYTVYQTKREISEEQSLGEE